MKIISSLVPATVSHAATPPADIPRLSMIPTTDPALSEELKKIRDQLQALQEESRRWRQACQEELARQTAQIKKEWQTQAGTLTENSKTLAARLEERLNALEKLPRFAEERMLQQIKESVKKEIETIRVPTPAAAPAPVPAPQDTWDTDLKRKEKTLQELKAELAKIPAVSIPVPVSPAPVEARPAIPEAPVPPDTDGLKKHLAQENTYGTSSRSSSLFAKLWLYLNESAIEIPMKNSKNNP